MALRLYLQNATPTYTPTTIRGAWDATGSAVTRYLGPRPAGTATTIGIAEASGTDNYDVLLGRWISDAALTAGTISGTAQWIAGVLESSTAANLFFHVHIFVTIGDSDTVRGTLLTDNTGATEWTGTATGRGEGAKTVTNVAIQAGDRIVVEIGYQAIGQSTPTTSYTGTMNYGNTGATDLAQGGTGVTTAPGYIEFSGADGLFYRLTSTLVADFNDGVMPAYFDGNYGSVAPTVSGGRLQVSSDGTVGPGTDYSGAITNNTTTLLQWDSVSVEIPTLPSNTGSTTYCYASLQIIDSDNATDGTLAGFTCNTKANTLTCYIYSSYSDSGGGATSLTLDTTNHRWLRLRRSGASALWDTSADGLTWTNRRTVAAPASWVNYSKVDVLLECYKDAGALALSEFDNLNVIPRAMPPPALIINRAAINRASNW